MATVTANGKYNYNSIYYGKPLDTWVREAYKSNCDVNGWEYSQLKMGGYGYDSIVISLIYIFERLKTSNDVENLSDAAHRGWCENYIFWRDNKPKSPYKQTFKLNDTRRNRYAELSYDKLNENEKDRVFARFVLKQLNYS